MLFYPIFTSSATEPAQQDTRINITNADIFRPVYVHLFFVDGASCSVADMFICLTESQTASFLASEFDPGTTGFLIAIATDNLGCPTAFNALMGDEYVKFSTGHKSSLAAEAAAGLNVPPQCDENSFTARLNFDGISYSLLGRALALSNLADRASGNNTLLILNRIGGNLATASARLTPVFGILYNDTENAFSFNFAPNTCQLISTLSNTFPRTVPRIEQIIPAGQSGWLKLWSYDDAAIFGAAINFNPESEMATSAFSHGHNLHKLTLTTIGTLTIPVFPPHC
ncbi:MAG: hypothetical protein AB7U82_09650 [Blastocatellales bacterium]